MATLTNKQKANSPVGIKYDADKPDFSLLSTISMTELAKVLTFGKEKYAAHNWRKGITLTRLNAAAMRHIFAHNNGEDLDSETGLSHLAHAMCCMMFAIELQKTRSDVDDRFVVTSL